MMHLIIKISVLGPVDRQGLERLRTTLQLNRQGRLTDDWDENFGNRRIERPNGEIRKISLYRHSTDSSWTVHVSTTEPEPNGDEMAALESELAANIAAAGFEAVPQAIPRYGP